MLTLAFAGACGARSALDPPADGSVTRSTTNGLDAANGQDATISIDGNVPHGFDCAEAGITYVYAFGEDNNLYSFYPTTGALTVVASLECDFTSIPFSMAIDHSGVAYVEYQDGALYRVSTKTGACERTPFVSKQHGFASTFGMGFVASAGDGGGTETLYVASNTDSLGEGTTSTLAKIDVTTFELTVLGPIGNAAAGQHVASPELTGGGAGKLYGFFSDNNEATPTYIVQLNPQTLQVESTVTLPSVEEGSGWAFGAWGGDFYTFTAPPTADSSLITRYRPSDQSITVVASAPPGVLLVGAGVSTCAPQQ